MPHASFSFVSDNGWTDRRPDAGDAVRYLASHGAKPEVWNQPNKRGWTPLLIAEGHRYGNFKPSFETIAAIKEVMLAAGVAPPPPTPPAATAELHGK